MCENIATTLRGSTVTREVVITIGIKIVAVIVGQFFPIGDIRSRTPGLGCRKFQIPPDIVVKYQNIDIVEVIRSPIW